MLSEENPNQTRTVVPLKTFNKRLFSVSVHPGEHVPCAISVHLGEHVQCAISVHPGEHVPCA